jgi:hypothetical protein
MMMMMMMMMTIMMIIIIIITVIMFERNSFIHSFTGAYSPGRTFGLPFGVSRSHTYN